MDSTNQYWIDRASKVMPGRQSNARALDEPSIFIDYGKGQRIWDVEGNEFLDLSIAMGPGIWGNDNQDYLYPIHKQLDTLLYVQSGALQTRLEVELAEKIVEHVPSAENVRFLLAGSEAVQMAIRLARGYTDRQQVLRFSGHYHGWIDNVFGGVVNPDVKEEPFPLVSMDDIFYTEGRSSSSVKETYMIPWNDAENLERVLDKYGHKIAVIIMEVFNSNGGGCPPKPGFLERVRELCDKHGVVLCFDEVITGFRTQLGGAQSIVGVTPDISIFGKAIAGGIPLAAVAGKKEIFDLIRNKKVVGAGTFNAFPVGMAAALSTMRLLEKDDGAVYLRRDSLQKRLESEMVSQAKSHGHSLITQGLPGAFCTHFTDQTVLWTIEDVINKSDSKKALQFRRLLREEGVIQGLGNRFMLTFALTEHDVDDLLERTLKIFKRL